MRVLFANAFTFNKCVYWPQNCTQVRLLAANASTYRKCVCCSQKLGSATPLPPPKWAQSSPNLPSAYSIVLLERLRTVRSLEHVEHLVRRRLVVVRIRMRRAAATRTPLERDERREEVLIAGVQGRRRVLRRRRRVAAAARRRRALPRHLVRRRVDAARHLQQPRAADRVLMEPTFGHRSGWR